MTRTKIDPRKIWQIFSVYILALIAAVICGSGLSAKATSSNAKQESSLSK